ncbi:unnamed protein product [Echinostoma caproni]|uniref:2-phosphoxylose phosphatase 1 n=1 Tax=Echinostoma caproni TaxID=27848 RepID=A0A183A1G6_9TREM|nr:unnamed protein product [Echinostoma caproni]
MLVATIILLIHVVLSGSTSTKRNVKFEQETSGSTVVSSSVAQHSELKLQHLHLLFRHGDRSPINRRIIDQSTFNKLWPHGYGQLTDIGIEQEFELGRWMRKKYGNFIPSEYNASDFHMRSTDIDRTLMSAESVIAGVFLNSSTPLAGYGIHWRPIPVHTVPEVGLQMTFVSSFLMRNLICAVVVSKLHFSNIQIDLGHMNLLGIFYHLRESPCPTVSVFSRLFVSKGRHDTSLLIAQRVKPRGK